MKLKLKEKINQHLQNFSLHLLRKNRPFALLENVLAPEASVPQGPRFFKPVTFSGQQLLTSASHLIEKAKKIFAQKGPKEESIKLCVKALEIPSISDDLRSEGLYLLGLLHDKRARTEAAQPWDLDCAIKTQETLLDMDYNFVPISKAKLQYMIARNVFRKALREHSLFGVERTISLMEGILAQDCLNHHQRIRLEANLAKAVFARSLFVPKEDEWSAYLS